MVLDDRGEDLAQLVPPCRIPRSFRRDDLRQPLELIDRELRDWQRLFHRQLANERRDLTSHRDEQGLPHPWIIAVFRKEFGQRRGGSFG